METAEKVRSVSEPTPPTVASPKTQAAVVRGNEAHGPVQQALWHPQEQLVAVRGRLLLAQTLARKPDSMPTRNQVHGLLTCSRLTFFTGRPGKEPDSQAAHGRAS